MYTQYDYHTLPPTLCGKGNHRNYVTHTDTHTQTVTDRQTDIRTHTQTQTHTQGLTLHQY